MAKRKRKGGRRRKYVSILSVLGVLAAASEMGINIPVANQAAGKIREAYRMIGVPNGPVKALVMVGTLPLVSSVINGMGAPKLPLGKAGVKL